MRELFPADVAEMARLSAAEILLEILLRSILGKLVSEDQREHPAGPRHVRAIAVAESFQHHLLFPGNAAKKQLGSRYHYNDVTALT